ncbi:unnamed protein product [Meganyctiphanes norvegica]|uniref:Secreted protein n=1 Tax=Meganyctiphanes norvegica TaxID=48144 RepID=A0AAV2QX08_MEGNR
MPTIALILIGFAFFSNSSFFCDDNFIILIYSSIRGPRSLNVYFVSDFLLPVSCNFFSNSDLTSPGSCSIYTAANSSSGLWSNAITLVHLFLLCMKCSSIS